MELDYYMNLTWEVSWHGYAITGIRLDICLITTNVIYGLIDSKTYLLINQILCPATWRPDCTTYDMWHCHCRCHWSWLIVPCRNIKQFWRCFCTLANSYNSISMEYMGELQKWHVYRRKSVNICKYMRHH